MVDARRRPDGAHGARGFTLVEVLVALSILAIALAAVLRTVGQAGYTSIALRDRIQAQWVAQDHLTRMQLERPWPEADTTTGTTQWGGREWRWREEVDATVTDGLRRVEVEVRLDDDRESLATLVTYARKRQP